MDAVGLVGRVWPISAVIVMAPAIARTSAVVTFIVDNAQLLFSRSGIRGYHRGAAFVTAGSLIGEYRILGRIRLIWKRV
jgi:hypothetical protein